MILNYAYWNDGHGFEINGQYRIRNKQQTEDIYSLFQDIDIKTIHHINYTVSKSNTANIIMDSFFYGLISNADITLNRVDSLLLLSRKYKYAAYIVGTKVNIMTDGILYITNNIPYGYKIDGNIQHTMSISEDKLYLLVNEYKNAV